MILTIGGIIPEKSIHIAEYVARHEPQNKIVTAKTSKHPAWTVNPLCAGPRQRFSRQSRRSTE